MHTFSVKKIHMYGEFFQSSQKRNEKNFEYKWEDNSFEVALLSGSHYSLIYGFITVIAEGQLLLCLIQHCFHCQLHHLLFCYHLNIIGSLLLTNNLIPNQAAHTTKMKTLSCNSSNKKPWNCCDSEERLMKLLILDPDRRIRIEDAASC